ncbi:MAG: hypothetical protein AAGB25_01150 [Pseudomonadota bacterium]
MAERVDAVFNRRAFLAAAMGACIAPHAAAYGVSRYGEMFKFPARIGYMRFAEDGYRPAGPADRLAWTGFAARMGGLIDDVRPLGFGAFAGVDQPPHVDEGASAAMAARAAAAQQGFDYALVYSVDTQRVESEEKPEIQGRMRRVRGMFRSVSEAVGNLAPTETTVGEAHLLSADGGPAVASVWLNPPAVRAGLLTKRKSTRETEALDDLTGLLEYRIRGFASDLYRLNRSIAD